MKRALHLQVQAACIHVSLGCAVLLGCATTSSTSNLAQAPASAVPKARADVPGPAKVASPLEQAEQQWKRRVDAKDIVASIADFRALADAAPQDPRPWLRMAEGQYLLGRLHNVEQPEPAEATAAFAEGLRAAREAKARADKGHEHEQQAAYWEAVNLLEWTAHAGFVERVDHEQELRLVLKNLQTCRPIAHDAARALAELLAMPAALEHRDLAQSKALFESLVTEDPWDLHARVAFAATYAVAAQDRDVFEQQLREIVERTSSSRGDAVERRLAARIGSRLLRDAPSLFE